jgi:glycosyltransferase involved in cell wall biosynthesis
MQVTDDIGTKDLVVDGGSVDGTYEALLRLAKEQELKDLPLKLKIHQIKRDWNHPRFAVFDGLQKAEARNLCSSDFCWQMDSDEIVHEDHYSKVRDLAETFPKNIDILSLPVIEYWGCENKTRMDITPWKWRISRNKQNITHGIPASLRAIDKNGDLYALSGTDGCDMIDRETHEPLSHLGFMSDEANSARVAALQGNEQARLAYENWFNQVVENLPCVFHFSWFDLERKIKTYKNYWTKHWESLRGEIYVDTAESNMFFDCPWSQVTDEMISQRAKQLSEIGGWIWHQKWKGQKTPWIKIKKQMPKTMMTFFKH